LIKVRRDWSYWNAPKFVFWLDLHGDEESVFMRMTSNCRNEVRRGYRNGVEFFRGDASDIEAFYRLMVETGRHKGIAFHDLDYYRRLLSIVNNVARAQLFFGQRNGKIITTGISVMYGKKAWLLYAASSPDSYKLKANRTLQWEMIRWAHAEGCERYDFRGTAASDPPSPDDPGYGVYKFKKSFGPEYTKLVGYYDVVSRPHIYRMFRFAEEKVLPIAYRLRKWMER
jgi:lipid II:glycine glycyltransferase (peptidoglycan interpeptide bridge formation enzyme)